MIKRFHARATENVRNDHVRSSTLRERQRLVRICSLDIDQRRQTVSRRVRRSNNNNNNNIIRIVIYTTRDDYGPTRIEKPWKITIFAKTASEYFHRSRIKKNYKSNTSDNCRDETWTVDDFVGAQDVSYESFTLQTNHRVTHGNVRFTVVRLLQETCGFQSWTANGRFENHPVIRSSSTVSDGFNVGFRAFLLKEKEQKITFTTRYYLWRTLPRPQFGDTTGSRFFFFISILRRKNWYTVDTVPD